MSEDSHVVLVCRGCCCGTTAKHPDVDHDHQLHELAAAGISIHVTDCLGPCRWSNVIVAVDPITGDQHWFTKILDDTALADVVQWLTDPTPEPPVQLRRHPNQRDRARVQSIMTILPTRRTGALAAGDRPEPETAGAPVDFRKSSTSV